MNDTITLQWIGIGLFVLAVAIAFYSIVITNRSLRETEKARRDMFLPVVAYTATSYTNGRDKGSARIQVHNVGHGPAMNVTLKVPSKATWKKKLIGPNESVFTEIAYQAGDTPIDGVLAMTYDDVFGRQIRSVLPISVRVDKEQLVQITLNMSSFDMHLPV